MKFFPVPVAVVLVRDKGRRALLEDEVLVARLSRHYLEVACRNLVEVRVALLSDSVRR